MSEAKDLKMRDFRILRSFAVFAAQDDKTNTADRTPYFGKVIFGFSSRAR